jgi:hypothetical protein
LLWSQRLHYRDPQLKDVPDSLAHELQRLLDTMDTKRVSHITGSVNTGAGLTERDVRHNTTTHLYALIRKVRALPGLDRFMLGESFHSLQKVASKHPAVLLTSGRGHSFALVFVPGSRHDEDPTASLISLNLRQEDLEALSISQQSTRMFRSQYLPTDGEDEEGRGMRHRSSSPWNHQMKLIWQKIVKPVLNHLAFKVCFKFILQLIYAATDQEVGPAITCSCPTAIVLVPDW